MAKGLYPQVGVLLVVETPWFAPDVFGKPEKNAAGFWEIRNFSRVCIFTAPSCSAEVLNGGPLS